MFSACPDVFRGEEPCIMVSVSFGQSGELSLQVYNFAEGAKLLSHKLSLVVVLVFLDAKIEWEKTVMEVKGKKFGSIGLDVWANKFLGII